MRSERATRRRLDREIRAAQTGRRRTLVHRGNPYVYEVVERVLQDLRAYVFGKRLRRYEANRPLFLEDRKKGGPK